MRGMMHSSSLARAAGGSRRGIRLFSRFISSIRAPALRARQRPATSGGGPGAAAAAPPAPRQGPPLAGTAVPRVVLKGGKSKLFSELQSPTVYGGAVDRVVGRPPPKAGDVVLVCDGAEQPLGWGLYNPDSMFRVRLMQLAGEVGEEELQRPDFNSLLLQRLRQAVELRRSVGLPSQDTTVFRLCNSEGDRLSGLIVDVLGDHLVVASSAAWAERHREDITAALRELTGIDSVVWRPSIEMLKEEGWPVVQQPSPGQNDGSKGSSSSADGGGGGGGRDSEGAGSDPGVDESSSGSSNSSAGSPVIVLEHGIKYAASPLGQKTGFYADQRDSRRALRALAAGRRVLDMCCFSGGFAVNAAVGGAQEVLGVDSSAAAVQLAQQNVELNGVSERCRFIKADVADFMKQALAEGQQWDVVVFDPPKLAPNRKALPRATHKYRRLNAQAMRLVAPGGLLMTCSCSGAMSQSGEFVPMLQAAAREAGRRITLLREAGPAMCHTLEPAYPEGKYLTNVLLRVL